MCIPAIMAGLSTIGTTVSTALGGTAASASALAGLSTIATVGSGAVTAYSSYQNAKMAEAAGRMNAKAADQASLDAIREGEQRSDQARRAAARLRADQRVGMTANSMDVSGVDAIGILDETTLIGEQDAFAIRESARSVAQGQSIQAANYRADARTARSESLFAPIRTVLGTASKVGSQYASYT